MLWGFDLTLDSMPIEIEHLHLIDRQIQIGIQFHRYDPTIRAGSGSLVFWYLTCRPRLLCRFPTTYAGGSTWVYTPPHALALDRCRT